MLSFLLLICVFCKVFSSRYDIPYSSLLLLIGLIMGVFKTGSIVDQGVQLLSEIEGEQLFYIFIPILIFESGFNSNLFQFKRNFKQILLLAFPGVILSSLLFAIGMHFIMPEQDQGFLGFFLIAAILGSTDPVAVSALFKQLKAPSKLTILLEGESLLNDGSSIVLYQTILELIKRNGISAPRFIWSMFTLCLGGPIVGVVFGIIFYYWLKKTPKIDKLVVSITFINAFMLFFVCEFYSWNISGILAVVFSSLILSYKAKLLIIEENVLEGLESVWAFVHFCLESFLFILTGIIMGKEIISIMNQLETWRLIRETLAIVIFFIFMNVARFVVILIFLPFMNDPRKYEYKIALKDCAIIAYSGIRGAFPLILCLSLVKDEYFSPSFRHLTTMITVLVIFMSIIFNGMTLKWLAIKLKIIEPDSQVERLKELIKKELILVGCKKSKLMRTQGMHNSTNWKLVVDVTGLREDFSQFSKQYKSQKKVKVSHSDQQVLIQEHLQIDQEFRMRVIYTFKEIIYQ